MRVTIIDQKGQHFALSDAHTVIVHEQDEKDERVAQVIIDTDAGIKHSAEADGIKDLLKDRPGVNLTTNKSKDK